MGSFQEKYNDPFFLRLQSHGTGRIFHQLKNLTRHFVHTGPFNIFALFTRDRLIFSLCSHGTLNG